MSLTENKKGNSFSKKNLVLIDSKTQFDKIVEDSEQSIPDLISRKTDQQQNAQLQDKEEIYVPRNGKIFPSQFIRLKQKHAKPIQKHGYFRLRLHHNLPNPQKYETTLQDLQFIKQLKKQYNFNSKYKFQAKTFIQIVESCEYNFHEKKTIKIHDDSSRILALLKYNVDWKIKHTLSAKQKDMLGKILIQIIDYWKKEKICRNLFPLVRSYWPKTDISMVKYNFWVPFRTRVMQQTKKKQFTSAQIKNFGSTQKQKNLNKQVKDACNFYLEVRELADTQFTQHQRYSKQLSKFHNYAALYGFKIPQYLSDVVEQKINLNYLKILDKLQRSPYFNNPTIKLNIRSRLLFKPVFQKSFEAHFNPQLNLLDLKQSFGIVSETQSFIQKLQRKTSFSQQYFLNPKIRKKSRDGRIYRPGSNKNGTKKVKVQE